MGVSERALQRGDLVRLARHISGKLCLAIEIGGQDHMVLRQDDASVRCFNSIEEAERYCQSKDLVLGNVRRKVKVDLPNPYHERITESDLRPGDTVTVRRYTSGSLCLMVERGGSSHTLFREDGSVHLFDALGEVRLYCRDRGLNLEIPDDWDKPRNPRFLELHQTASEHRSSGPWVDEISSSLEAQRLRRSFPVPEDEKLPPLLDPEREGVIRQTLVEVVKSQASKDLEGLVFLTEERERLSEELSLELIRREALGPKSCTCDRCIDRLSSPLREVQEKIDKIWSWWADSLGTTPAEVVAGRWS